MFFIASKNLFPWGDICYSHFICLIHDFHLAQVSGYRALPMWLWNFGLIFTKKVRNIKNIFEKVLRDILFPSIPVVPNFKEIIHIVITLTNLVHVVRFLLLLRNIFHVIIVHFTLYANFEKSNWNILMSGSHLRRRREWRLLTS